MSKTNFLQGNSGVAFGTCTFYSDEMLYESFALFLSWSIPLRKILLHASFEQLVLFTLGNEQTLSSNLTALY